MTTYHWKLVKSTKDNRFIDEYQLCKDGRLIKGYKNLGKAKLAEIKRRLYGHQFESSIKDLKS